MAVVLGMGILNAKVGFGDRGAHFVPLMKDR